MRLVPLAVWSQKLNKDELFQAVQLQTWFTSSNQLAVESSYIYCYCITLLLKGAKPKEAYTQCVEEANRRARISGNSTIKYWFENDIDSDDVEEMPKQHYKPVTYLKIALLWAFYYLKKEYTFEQAMKDIIDKQGETDANAAVVGGLLGAAYGIDAIPLELIDKVMRLDTADRGIYSPKQSLVQLMEIAVDFPSSLTVKWDEETYEGERLNECEKMLEHLT